MSTITQTITLQPGEKFTLPPNSTVTAIIGSITATCSIPEPTQLDCFAWQFATSDGSGGASPAYDSVFVKGLILNGISYMFTSDYNIATVEDSHTHADQFRNALASTSIKNLFFNIQSYSEDDSNRGTYGAVWFRMPANLGTNSYIIAEGDVTGSGIMTRVPILFPIVNPVLLSGGIKSHVSCPSD